MNNNTLSKYISFSLVFCPWLTPYWFPGTEIHMETLFMLINVILCFLWKKNVWVNKRYLRFFIYALFVPIIGFVLFRSIGALKGSYITIILFTLSLLFIVPHLNIDYISRYYRNLVIFASVFFIIQTILKSVGHPISGLIPFLPNKYGVPTSAMIVKQLSESRNSSFFLEPSHFAQYVLGYLALQFGRSLNMGKMFTKEIIVITVVLLVTLSGTAYMMVAILWGMAFILSKKPFASKLLVLLLSALFAVIFIGKMSSSEEGTQFLNRTEELSSDQERLSSGYVRIFRGYMVYSKVPITSKVFGVGSGFIANTIEESPYFWMFFDEERYVNNAQVLLIGYGLLGTLLFLLFLLSLWSRNDYRTCFFIALFIGLSFMELLWAESRMLIYISIPYLINYRIKYERVQNA